jgi:hypothetical protein
MSQPTLSRLENLPDWRALARIGLGQIDLYYRSFARPPARIVFDIDDTGYPAHGRHWPCVGIVARAHCQYCSEPALAQLHRRLRHQPKLHVR